MQRFLALLVLAVLIATGCSGESTLNAGTSANRSPIPGEPEVVESATSTPVAEAPTEVQPEPEPEPEPEQEPEPEPDGPPIITERGTVDEPLPIAGAAFSFSGRFNDGQWNGEITGLTPVSRSDYQTDVEGDCYAVVGVITPTIVDEGIIPSASSAPDFGLLTSGRLYESSFSSNCEEEDIELLGYTQIEFIEATENTEVPFFALIFVESEGAELDLMVAGDVTGEDIRYFTPDLLDTVPQATITAGTVDADLTPLVEAQFEYVYVTGEDTWDVQMLGMVPAELQSYSDDDGDCYMILAVFTPTVIGDGSVSSSSTAPRMSLIADGLGYDPDFSCDDSVVEASGYNNSQRAEVTLNSAYPVAIPVQVRAGAEVQAVVVGSPSSDDVLLFTPAILNGIPTATAGGGENVAAEQDLEPLLDAEFTFSDRDGDMWEGTIFGLIETELNSSADTTGSCIAVIGVLTPTSLETGGVSSGFSAPDFSLIASGERLTYSNAAGKCSSQALGDAGFTSRSYATVTEGTTFPFFTLFLVPEGSVPEALVAGRPTEDNALYYLPQVLSSMPNPGETNVGDLNQTLLPLEGATFEHEDYSDDTWDLELYGLIEGELSRNTSFEGTCYLLVGKLTPTLIGDGSISGGFSTSEFTAVAGGRLIGDQSFGCDNDTLTSAGYGGLSDAEVTEGTEYKFMTAFFVRTGEDLEAVIYGNPAADNATYWEPTVITAAP